MYIWGKFRNMNKELAEDFKNWQKMVRKYIKPNNKIAVIQMMTSILPFIGLWILMYISLSYSYWITLALGILNAFFLVRIFIIQHDCGHQSYFKNRKLNRFVGRVCSVFSLVPFTYWAKSHNYHHEHTVMMHEHRDIGDINTLSVEEYKALSPLKKLQYRLYRSSLVMFLIGPLYYILIHNRLPLIRFKSWKKVRQSLIWNNLLIVTVYCLVGYLVGWKKFIQVQIPITVFFSVVAIWFFYVQHQHEENYRAWKDKWDYLHSAIKGSTFYKLPKIMHWLTGNIGYHHIHHLNSMIPNYNLKKCHDENPIFEKHIIQMTVLESFKTIKNKLWDEASGRMISFREYKRIYA